MNEIYKDIEGFNGKYQISNSGNVKSLYFNREHIMKLSNDKDGYPDIALSLKGKHKTIHIHRLVAKTFIPNPNNYPQVNHKNGIKTDNRVENLEWCTDVQNRRHAWKMGLYCSERHNKVKLTRSQVKDIREKYATGIRTGVSLSKEYNVSSTNIYDIIKYRIWKNYNPND